MTKNQKDANPVGDLIKWSADKDPERVNLALRQLFARADGRPIPER